MESKVIIPIRLPVHTGQTQMIYRNSAPNEHPAYIFYAIIVDTKRHTQNLDRGANKTPFINAVSFQDSRNKLNTFSVTTSILSTLELNVYFTQKLSIFHKCITTVQPMYLAKDHDTYCSCSQTSFVVH